MQKVEGSTKKNSKKKGQADPVQASTRGGPATSGRQPALGPRPDCRRPLVTKLPATSGRGRATGPAAGRYEDRVGLVFFFFLFDASSYTLINFLFEVWGMGQGFWENGCTIHPFFQAPP
jgi:hypothetical protein